MLQEEFKRLITLFQEAAEGKPVQLEEVFKHSLQVFEQMKQELTNGSQEDRVEAMRLMSEMYQQMKIASKRIAETSGLTEEQLVSYAENPSNFTPEQWKTIQASKEQIVHAGSDLAKILSHPVKTGSHEKKPPQEKVPKGSKDKLSKKSQWMKS